MTTPNDDFIGRFKERQPISSRLQVEQGKKVSPFGKQRDNLVFGAKPLPDHAIPCARPQRIGKNSHRVIDGVSEEDPSAYTEELGEATDGMTKHLAQLYIDGDVEAIDLL